MTITQCDRCGMPCKPTGHRQLWVPVGAQSYENKHFDLCETCFDRLATMNATFMANIKPPSGPLLNQIVDGEDIQPAVERAGGTGDS